MTIKPREIVAIHEEALVRARRYLVAEFDMIEIIEPLDRSKVFLHYGVPNLKHYVMMTLGLSKDVAGNFITVTRKSMQIPALKEAIRVGDISVSHVRKMSAVITPSNQAEWIQKAMNLSTARLTAEVARALSPDFGRHIGLSLSFPKEIHKMLKRAVDLESQRQKKPVSYEDALGAALETYLAKADPLKIAERAINRAHAKVSASNQEPAKYLKVQQESVRVPGANRQSKILFTVKHGHEKPLATRQDQEELLASEHEREKSLNSPFALQAVKRLTKQNSTPLIKSHVSRRLEESTFTHQRLRAVPTRRTPIPAKSLHEVRMRDQAQCTERDPKTGERC